MRNLSSQVLVEVEQRPTTKYVGKPHLRTDSIYRLRGELKYVGDLSLSKMLYAALLHSPYAHALIKSIDVSDALRLPGVVSVITYLDVPQHRFGRTFSPVPWKVPRDRRILDRKVRFVGDLVAAVAAESPGIAEDALDLISVEYEVLEVVTSAEEAMADDAPLVHDDVVIGDMEVKIERNIGYRDRIEIGNRDEAYSRVAKLYEDRFRTQILYNAAIEPRAMLCNPRPDGSLEVWCTTQSIHGTRYWLAEALKIPMSRIVVHAWPLGGGFGAKYNMAIHEPVIAYLALRTRRPVKYVATRQEDFYTTGRRPAVMDVKIGVGKDARLEVMELRAILQSGAYADHMIEAVSCVGGWFVSSYAARYRYYEGCGVYTNLPVYGAMRGFGNPQQNFAVESLIDEIAEDLGLDPLEFRVRNLPKLGDIYYGQGPTVTTVIESIELEGVMREAAKLFGWDGGSRRVEDGWIIATGLAVGHHTSGTGGQMSERQDRLEGTGAMIKINEDGSVNLTTSMVEMGPGEHDTLATICAEELGVRPESIYVNASDTQVAPFDMGTHASRGTFVGGLGVIEAARRAKEIIIEEAALMLGCPRDEIVIEGGKIYQRGKDSNALSIADVALSYKTKRGKLIIAEASLRPNAAPPSWAAVFAEIALDPETGVVKVRRIVGGFDIGTVVNPPEAEGQAIGGIATGIGYALMEEVVVGEGGHYLNPNFMEYGLPSAMDVSDVKVVFADSYEPRGPFGARSIGELATNPVASAIANAVSRALGRRVKELPMKPEKVLRALKG